MKYSESLKKNKDFQYIYRKGTSYANKYLVMYVLENGTGQNRLGISVSKKVGNSVVRSRSKRLITESYRLNEKNLKTGYDFVFIARNSIEGKSFFEVEEAMKKLFSKAGLYKQ